MDAIHYWEKFFSLSWWAIWPSDSGAWGQWANRLAIPGPLQPALGGGTATLLTFSRLWNILFLFPSAGPIPAADFSKRTSQGSHTFLCLSTARLSDDYLSLSSFNHNWARPSKGTGMRLIPTEPTDFLYRNSPCLTSGISAALHCLGPAGFMLLDILCADYPSLQ